MTYYDKVGERKEPYKEDETRGSSIIQPLNYKCDMLSQAWMDSRVLATLDRWLEKVGYSPRSMSEVARRPLEVLVEHLVETGQVEMIENTAEARLILQTKYRVTLNRGQRAGKNVLHNQILSDRRSELGERVKSGSRFNDAQKPVVNKNQVSEDVLREAVRRFKELEQQDRDRIKDEAIGAAKNSNMIVKEDKANE